MISALRVSLASILVSVGMLAAFFACYAASYPAVWVANVSSAGKAFQVGTGIITAGAAFLICKRERLERHPWSAALLVACGWIAIVSAATASFTALGRL